MGLGFKYRVKGVPWKSKSVLKSLYIYLFCRGHERVVCHRKPQHQNVERYH
jgi:hypothetical protein